MRSSAARFAGNVSSSDCAAAALPTRICASARSSLRSALVRIRSDLLLDACNRLLGRFGGFLRRDVVADFYLRHPAAHACKKFAKQVFRQRAGEAVGQLTFAHEDDCWNAAHAKHRGELLFLVAIDFGKLHRAGVFGDDFFEQRAERLARLAPCRPEVDEHRLIERGIDDLGLEIGLRDVEDGR